MTGPLFYGRGELRNGLEAQGQKMRQAVGAEPEDSLKQADVDEWAAALAHHFAVACAVLKTDEVWMEPPKPVKLDVSRDPGRYFSDYALRPRQQLPRRADHRPRPVRGRGRRLQAEDEHVDDDVPARSRPR